MNAALKNDRRMPVVLDTGTISRGNQGSDGERNIRKNLVDADLEEAVVVLPENRSFDTTAKGIILVTNWAKRRPGQALLVNASKLFSKVRPKNFLTDQHCRALSRVQRRRTRISRRHRGKIGSQRLQSLPQPLRGYEWRRLGAAPAESHRAAPRSQRGTR